MIEDLTLCQAGCGDRVAPPGMCERCRLKLNPDLDPALDVLQEVATATPIATRIREAMAGFREPIIRWSAELQPVPLHRSRVVFAKRGIHSHLEDADIEFRNTLQAEWRLVHRFRRPIPKDTPLAVFMSFAGRDRTVRGGYSKRPDASNLLKAVEDAGNGILWADDSQILSAAACITGWGKGVRPLITVQAWEHR